MKIILAIIPANLVTKNFQQVGSLITRDKFAFYL